MILHKSYRDMADKEIVDLIIAGNEEAVRNVFRQTPIYMFISAVFLAPLKPLFG